MRYVTNCLLNDLYAQTEKHVNKAITEWQQLPVDLVLSRPVKGGWSAGECLEHLNSYGRYYLPAIAKAISQAATTNMKPGFSSGWLGNYFYKLMLIDDDGNVKKKMVSPKAHRPSAGLDAAAVVGEFISQQEKLAQLITLAYSTDLEKAKVPISIAPFIKLKLGDTFLFYIAHIVRHLAQAEVALKAAGYLKAQHPSLA